ncbi:MAG: TerB family tellurite resistance protein [Pseudomonadota bacterium]
MFDKLLTMFRPKTAATAAPETSDDERALAVAALLVEAARADENYDVSEKAIIDGALEKTFALSGDDAAALRARAEDAQSNALDIQRFTRRAKEMPHNEKLAFIETLWEIVLSDGDRNPYEDTLMRRICGLIYVEDRESGLARARVEERIETS